MDKIRIGIADDNKDFCEILMDFFKEKDNVDVVFVTHDGLKTIDAIQKHNPDVLLLDMIMPYMDGLGVLETINEMKLPTYPKTIVLSAVGQEAMTQKSIDLGAEYYIIKPFNFDLLLKRIYQLTGKESVNEGNLKYARAISCIKRGSSMEAIELNVSNILHEIGIPAHIKGYNFLREAIMMAIQNAGVLSAVTKELYPAIAEKNHTTSSRVDRACRHAIDVAWNRGNLAVINKIFGYTALHDNGKPSNSEFIALISDQMRLECKAS